MTFLLRPGTLGAPVAIRACPLICVHPRPHCDGQWHRWHIWRISFGTRLQYL